MLVSAGYPGLKKSSKVCRIVLLHVQLGKNETVVSWSDGCDSPGEVEIGFVCVILLGSCCIQVFSQPRILDPQNRLYTVLASSAQRKLFVMQISPTTLFLIEGTAQHPIQMCWGDGFVTDGAVLAQHGLSDPRPFFDELLQKPYLNNVIISPHYYGPSVSGNTEE